jgi:uncharacterized membrane protein
MSLIPEFEIGIWNAWIFMIWWIVIPFLSSFIIKEKNVSKILYQDYMERTPRWIGLPKSRVK